MGGAIAAAVLGGESLEDAQDRLSRPAARFEPRSDRSAYDALHLYGEAERAVAPLSHALARMTQPTASPRRDWRAGRPPPSVAAPSAVPPTRHS